MNNWFFLHNAVYNIKNKDPRLLKAYAISSATGALFSLICIILRHIDTSAFSIKQLTALVASHVALQALSTVLLGLALAIPPFFLIPGSHPNPMINVIGYLTKIGLSIGIFVLYSFQYYPLADFEIGENDLLQDIIFAGQLISDSSDGNLEELYDISVTEKDGVKFNETNYFVAVYFKDGMTTKSVIFRKDEFYKNKFELYSDTNTYNITCFGSSSLLSDFTIIDNRVVYDRQTILDELLEQNIEITMRRNDKGTIFIDRPHIGLYDDVLIGINYPDISLYVVKDGEFYETWNFSSKDWLNDLTFLAKNRKYGEYELTLVYDYNEDTGDHTPISNTIKFTVDPNTRSEKGDLIYESIPLTQNK